MPDLLIELYENTVLGKLIFYWLSHISILTMYLCICVFHEWKDCMHLFICALVLKTATYMNRQHNYIHQYHKYHLFRNNWKANAMYLLNQTNFFLWVFGGWWLHGWAVCHNRSHGSYNCVHSHKYNCPPGTVWTSYLLAVHLL